MAGIENHHEYVDPVARVAEGPGRDGHLGGAERAGLGVGMDDQGGGRHALIISTYRDS
jgi:hypothetical protein